MRNIFRSKRNHHIRVDLKVGRLLASDLLQPRVIGRQTGVDSWRIGSHTAAVLRHDSDYNVACIRGLNQWRSLIIIAGTSGSYTTIQITTHFWTDKGVDFCLSPSPAQIM